MILETLKARFPGKIIGTTSRNQRRATATVRKDALLPISEHLFREEGMRFIIASAVHTRNGYEIYYHFSLDKAGLILNLHVILEHKNPEVESLSNMFEASNWIEREMHELFGITFKNHPTPELLLSEGNWATGEYPYRKNFNSNGGATS